MGGRELETVRVCGGEWQKMKRHRKDKATHPQLQETVTHFKRK